MVQARFHDHFTINGVYYLESGNPHTNPIAIRPEFTPPDYISWKDTSHGRILHVKHVFLDGTEIKEALVKLPERMQIESSSGEIYQLVKLTKDIFDKKLRQRVAGGDSLSFNNDQEVQEYYLKANFMTI